MPIRQGSRRRNAAIAPTQRFVEDDLAFGSNPMDLKDVLGQIEADCCNLPWGGSSQSRR